MGGLGGKIRKRQTSRQQTASKGARWRGGDRKRPLELDKVEQGAYSRDRGICMYARRANADESTSDPRRWDFTRATGIVCGRTDDPIKLASAKRATR